MSEKYDCNNSEGGNLYDKGVIDVINDVVIKIKKRILK